MHLNLLAVSVMLTIQVPPLKQRGNDGKQQIVGGLVKGSHVLCQKI